MPSAACWPHRNRRAALAPVIVLVLAVPVAAGTPDLRDVYARPPADWPAPQVDPSVPFAELGRPPIPAVPDPALAAVGERLFHDPRLSLAGDMACSTCHDPGQAWADGRARPTGHGGREGRRNTPSLLGTAGYGAWRWDGRHGSLTAAVLAPLLDPAEMANPDGESVSRRLAVDYGPVDVGAALAAFVGGIDEETRFDRFVSGDHGALTDEEIHGLHLFRTKAGCANCHFGPALTDGGFHNLRLSSFGEASQDLGRHTVTARPEDAGRFRTPSLRHVGRTAPYMHNGLFPSLEGVVHFYARGGGEVRARNQAEADRPLFAEAARLDPLIRPLDLTPTERAALTAFLRTL